MADIRTLVGAALALMVLATLPVAIAPPVSADPSYDDDDDRGPCPGEPKNDGVDMNDDGYINRTECAPVAPSFGGEDVDLVAVDSGGKVVQPRDLEFVTPDGRIDVSKVERARANGRKTVKARDA